MRTIRLTALLLPALISALSVAACTTAEEGVGTDVGEAIENNAKIVDTIGPNAKIEGKFDPRIRTYGYVVPLKAGAKITVTLEAKGGADAKRDDMNAPLDTQLIVNAPYTSRKSPGARVAEKPYDAAPNAPVTFKADRDQSYLVSFLSSEDTGTGSYKLSLQCEGTDFQCQRADFDKPCKAEQLFVQGATIQGNTTWDACEVVLLESATVAEGSTLTIKPGVTVKGNFIDPQRQNPSFGNVTLTVNGLLQVAGTQKAPVAFTSFKEDRGWGGLVIKSKGNSMTNVVIEKAHVGVDIPNGGNIAVTDSLIQGVVIDGWQSEAGIRAQADVDATFTRALVKGFSRGLHLANAQKMTIEDSVIRENGVGIQVDGASPITSCANVGQPQRWHDPVIRNSDIVENVNQGVLINGSDVLVQITKSNLVNNKSQALLIQGGALNPQSFFRENNVYDNNGGSGEVVSFHRQGTLDISQNYWKEISDPELSANWNASCGGQGTTVFTGFSPKLIKDAGPRQQSTLPPAVKAGCFKHAAQ